MNDIAVAVRRRSKERIEEPLLSLDDRGEDPLVHEEDTLQDALQDSLGEHRMQPGDEPGERSAADSPSLPFFDQIQAAFGRYDLGSVEEATGMDVADLTSRSGVHGLTLNGRIALPSGADLFTVAHEAAHAIQQQRGIAPESAGGIDDAYEAQADAAAYAVVEGRSAESALDGGPRGGTSGESVGVAQFFQDTSDTTFGASFDADMDDGQEETEETGGEATLTEEPLVREDPTPPDDSGSPGGEPEPAPSGGGGGGDPSADPEIPTVDLQSVPGGASRQEGSGGGAGNGAVDLPRGPDVRPEQVQTTFSGMAPSTKTSQYAQLGGAIGESTTALHNAKHDSVPEFHGTMSADGSVEEPPEVSIEGTSDADVAGFDNIRNEQDPDLDPGAGPGLGRSPMSGTAVATWLEGQSESGDAKLAARAAIRKAQEGGEGVSTAVEAPEFHLEGSADPQQIVDTATKATEDAAAAFAEASGAVMDGPGPELAQLQDLDVPHILETPAPPAVPDVSTDVPGMSEFVEMNLPADVQAEFDAQNADAMQASLAEADAHIATSQADYDTQFDAAVSEAETAVADASKDAQLKQEEAVGQARRDIQTERQTAIDNQKKATKELDQKVEGERASVQRGVDTRVKTDQRKADKAITDAQAEAAQKIREGEREAAAKEREVEEEDEGFWGGVWDAVTDVVAAIADAIVAVWDAVREAVNFILDAAVELAKGIIDAAISFISEAIGQLIDMVADLVCGLLEKAFPELAEKLREALDELKTWVEDKLNEFGDWLKEQVEGFITALKDSFNALADAIEGAVAFAATLVEAVITGDWDKVLDMALDAILALAGISREEFEATFGSAREIIQSVIEDPGSVINNAVAAVSLGFEKFGNNFLQHFISGAIEWITGAISIEMPGSLDVAGLFDIVLQVLGLTPEFLKEKAESLVGSENVELIERVWEIVEPMTEGGWSGIWEEIQGQLGDLWGMVVDTMADFIVEKAVIAGARMLATMATGVGAIVEALIAAFNFVMWLRDNIQRIMGVVTTVVESIADFVAGSIDPAAGKIEEFLGGMVPVAIDLLAKLLGLGGIPDKIQSIIEGVRKKIDDAVEGVIKRIRDMFGAGGDDEEQEGEGDYDGEVGETIEFTSDGEGHRLWIEANDTTATIMVASNPLPLADRIADWDTRLAAVDDEGSGLAGDYTKTSVAGLLSTAAAEMNVTLSEANQVLAAEDAESRAEEDEDTENAEQKLAGVLQKLFEAFGDEVDNVPIDAAKTLTSEQFRLFKTTMAELDLEEASTEIWMETVEQLLAVTDAYNMAPKDGRWIDLSSDAFKKLVHDFQVPQKISAAFDRQVGDMTGQTVALWSGNVAKQAAAESGKTDVFLEGTPLGKAFDKSGLPSEVQASMVLWAGISEAYANKLADQAEVVDWVGFVDWSTRGSGNIAAEIELPVVRSAIENASKTAAWHGAANKQDKVWWPGEIRVGEQVLTQENGFWQIGTDRPAIIAASVAKYEQLKAGSEAAPLPSETVDDEVEETPSVEAESTDDTTETETPVVEDATETTEEQETGPRTISALTAALSSKAADALNAFRTSAGDRAVEGRNRRFLSGDGVYDVGAAEAYWTSVAGANVARAITQADQHLTSIRNILRETSSAGRPDASVGDGSSEGALDHEARTGQPVGGKGHSRKVRDSLSGLRDRVRQLKTLKGKIDDAAKLEEIDGVIADAEAKIVKMSAALRVWDTRVGSFPAKWNDDGTSKVYMAGDDPWPGASHL